MTKKDIENVVARIVKDYKLYKQIDRNYYIKDVITTHNIGSTHYKEIMSLCKEKGVIFSKSKKESVEFLGSGHHTFKVKF